MNENLSSRPRPSGSSSRMTFDPRRLLPKSQSLLSPTFLKEDALAGLRVACVALPLSLAIALASGVSPSIGLVTAIVAGIVCALWGGTPLAVSGPSAAMAVLIASSVQEYGLGGLLVIGLVVGALQLLTGVLGLGRLLRFVPVPVVAGLTAGLGAILLIGQLPRALGLPPPEQSRVLDVLLHSGQLLHQTRPVTLGLTVLTLGLALGLPRLSPRLPAALLAMLIPTGLVLVLGLDVQTLDSLPHALPQPGLPRLPESGWGSLVGTALIVYALASLQTLLTSGMVDSLSRASRSDPDQELVGQGLGNVAVALFGGIPVTGLITRSTINVQAGARTRRAALFQALVLLGALGLLLPVLGRLPVAALAGVLLALALRMLHPRELRGLWRVSRPEAAVYVITFVATVTVDLLVGVQAGLLVALAIAAFRLSQARAGLLPVETSGPYRFLLSGPLTFLSSEKLETLRAQARGLEPQRGVVFELSEVTVVDASGARALVELVDVLLRAHRHVALQGARPEVQQLLLRQEHGARLEPLFALTESDVSKVLREEPRSLSRARLVHGVERFRQGRRARYGPLFDRLAQGQSPHTLFITCSDSRINPHLITSLEPGELFIVRNVGNLVPEAHSPLAPAVSSAVEYALEVLGVTDVVVCGHSGCGAMKALLSPKPPEGLPGVQRWLEEGRELVSRLPAGTSAEEAARANALAGLAHLLSYPVLRHKYDAGQVRLHAWFYDVGPAELLDWDEASATWRPLGAPRPEASPADAQPEPRPEVN